MKRPLGFFTLIFETKYLSPAGEKKRMAKTHLIKISPCMLFWFFSCSLATLLCTCLVHGKEAKIKAGCNPLVDMLFVLDGAAYVNRSEFQMQKEFIGDILRRHQAPSGAVRFGAMICSEQNVTTIPFENTSTSFFEKLDKIRFSSDQESQKTHCLESINYTFETKSRQDVPKTAVILRAGDKWNDIYTLKQAIQAKKNGVSRIVIAIGIKDYASLYALQSLASDAETFFVVSGYKDLKNLAQNLSKGPCQPISTELTSKHERFTVKTTTPAPKPICVQVSASMYRRHVPGLGYIREQCPNGTAVDTAACKCV
ncbi:hypothetical protein CHS0354_011464 [Potamilus streckersoni]|uniref:VWFA domain-containing protein n=1 Tax=Potamilus streckersoni TaxID=2493646 RepID=A0AAE0SLQ2_9BIVA|nr:hypothetical protein CHS0354_011464 [Potamilus streckersoni]